MTNTMVKYEAACTALAEASRVDEAKSIRDKAEAVRVYARQAQNLELEQQAIKIRLRAERRAGELLKEAKANGTRERQGGNRRSKSPNGTLKLADLGITRRQSSDWQKMAEIPAADFESRLESVPKVTTRAILHPEVQKPPRPPAPYVSKPTLFTLISAMHKAIRRNDQKEALLAAWQLDAATGSGFKPNYGGQLWSELRRITAEDIGQADTGVYTDIYVLWKFWEKATQCDNPHEPWRLFTTAAVLRLCEAPKSRKVDHANILLSGKIDKIIAELKGEKFPHAVPDYAHDGIHTGKKTGKNRADFVINEDAALFPNAVGIDDPFLEELFKKIMETKKLAETGATPVSDEKAA